MSWRRAALACIALLLVLACAWILKPLIARGQSVVVKSHEFAQVPDGVPIGCKATDEMALLLRSRFDETPRGTGLRKADRVELWHSPGGRTWTLLEVTAKGYACALAFGESWYARR